MTVVVNGQAQEFPGGGSLAEFVEQLGLKADRIAVELNREIAPRSRWTEISLADGDRLEIVHFVGGGSDQHSLPLKTELPFRGFVPKPKPHSMLR